MVDKNPFYKRLDEIKNFHLFEKSLNPILANKTVEDKLTKYKIYMYAILLAVVIIGIVLIIVGAFEQKRKQVLIPLVVIGLFFVICLSLIDIFIWISIMLSYLRKIVLKQLDKEKIMHLYLTFLGYFDYWKIFSSECFIDYDGFLNLGGTIKDLKFKTAVEKNNITFYWNQKQIDKTQENLHNWNLKLDLSTSAIDKMKRKPKEAVMELIKLQLYKNIEVIAKTLFEVYYEKSY